MNRRQLLARTAAVASALTFRRLAGAQSIVSPPAAGLIGAGSRDDRTRPHQSIVSRPAAGLIEVALEARDNWIPAGGKLAYASAFNGQIPGPTIEARAGDTIRIEFQNALTEATNLHFHGLHVSPAGNGDNSFLEVPAGAGMTYELNIPRDHPSGMFWYHPHLHGSVARQVSRGLAGLIVIRGDFDDLPEVRTTPEYLLVLQDFNLSAGGQVLEPNAMERIQGREGPLVTINGVLNPTISLNSGGWTRVRLLNASASRFYRLQLEGHIFTVVGTDGGLIASPAEAEEILLVPGQRYDLFIWGRASSGSFRLLDLPYNRLGTRSGGMGMGAGAAVNGAGLLATFEYGGAASTPWTLPQRLRIIDALPAPRATRSFTFGMGMGMFGGGFTINGRQFDKGRVDTRVALDATEDWDLINASTMDHPFHIHTNPFQVMGTDGAVERAWRDVVLVPAGRRVRTRLRFSDYVGKAIYHCHILDHEDLGMMGVFEVIG